MKKDDDPIWNEFMTDQDKPEQTPDTASSTTSFTPEISDHPLSEIVVTTLRTIYDPEIPVNIYDLGLIYKVLIDAENNVHIDMTLTTPGCPVAQTFPGHIAQTIEALDEINHVHVEVVWDPPWSQDYMSDEAKLLLGLL